MDTYNIHYAKTHLSRLIEQATKGKPFVIAKGGRPMVRVTPIAEPTIQTQGRMGFLKGQIKVPDDFDEMYSNEIEKMFGTGE